jgi:hypothetical protein
MEALLFLNARAIHKTGWHVKHLDLRRQKNELVVFELKIT